MGKGAYWDGAVRSSIVHVDYKPHIWQPLRWRTHGSRGSQDVYSHFSDESPCWWE